ncbi:putative NADP-dependent mannitol dehydrogenase [Glarea lozoyensis 74030]|uniref:Putative NADP-dependent mannitol dehydrogenase n=1 Tax=Glarea lozoyensis (strain ATCC 74030 / MF5533) TaxID=1104152 RepID=H0EZQ2_GLAL7|nr:putative NADP-dependent mannitol dehydrogenase [Glarea lozoyensis 74030]
MASNSADLDRSNDRYLHHTVQSLFSLKGKVIVITGGARGIGLAFGIAVAEAGGDVAVLDVLETPHEHFSKLQNDYGVKVKLYKTDVTKFEILKATFDEVVEDFGRIDGCVAAAGICPDQPFLERSPEAVARCFDINITGVFFTAQLAAAQMYLSDYCSSKGAVLSMARELAVELADRNVRVNSISPGKNYVDA